MKNKALHKSLKKYDKSKQNKDILISGELGITLNNRKLVDVPNRKGFVYVRLKGNTSEVIQAYNAAVSQVYDMPVFVVRSKGIYKVVGRNIDRYQNQFGQAPFLPKHGAQHSFNHELGIGGDIAWIYSQQFMPLLSYPSGTTGGMTLSLQPHFYEWNGTWRYAQNTGTPNYSAYVPTITGSARMVLSYIDPSDNSIKLVPGTPFSNSLTGSSQIAQYIPDIPREIGIPLAAVRLTTGTTTIGWENIYDVRDFYTVGKPSGSTGGSGGGIAGIIAQDEGILLGTGTVFNFVGSNVQASISGSVVRVFVTGSTGGGGVSLVTEDLTPQISGTNTVFSLTFTPNANTARIYYNGVRQRYLYDYYVSGSTVGLLYIPTTGSVLTVDYNETSVTGTGGGISGIDISDEGTLQGTTASLNFFGEGITASISGTQAAIWSNPNFYGLRSFVLPPSGSWSWDNQVSSTIDSTYGYEYMYAPRQSALKIASRYRSPANNHYQIDMAFYYSIGGALKGVGTGNDSGLVAGFRDGNGKLVSLLLAVASNAWQVSTDKWTSAAAYSANYKIYGPAAGVRDVFKDLQWVRIKYDGTNIVFYLSIDGNHFEQFDTRTATDFLTTGTPSPFWGAYANGNDAAVALVSWKETALP